MTSPIIDWLPYQRAWIVDKSRFKVGMMTRRGGKSFSSGGEIVDDCTSAEISGVAVRWTVLSRSERTAQEMIEDAVKPLTKAFWGAYNVLKTRAQPDFYEDKFRGEDDAVYRTFEVRYPGGSRVTALSASPDAARGFGGNILFDEFAFHANSRAIWGAAFPVAARGKHKVRVVSTPNGKGNKFYELMTGEDAAWSRHHVDIYEAVQQGLDVNIEELRAGLGDEQLWGQEFELKWLEGSEAWLSYELIIASEDPEAGEPRAYQGGPCYLGVDIAARNDLFVATVFERVGERLIEREQVAEKKLTFAQQDAVTDRLFDTYQIVRSRWDQTGMGEKPVEDAQRRYGASRVEGVMFSVASKLDLANALKGGMEDRAVRFRAGDPTLRADLHAVQSVIGPTGNRRLLAGGDTDGHADRFWSSALAVSAAASPYQALTYTPVPRGGELFEDRDIRITAGFGAREGLW